MGYGNTAGRYGSNGCVLMVNLASVRSPGDSHPHRYRRDRGGPFVRQQPPDPKLIGTVGVVRNFAEIDISPDGESDEGQTTHRGRRRSDRGRMMYRVYRKDGHEDIGRCGTVRYSHFESEMSLHAWREGPAITDQAARAKADLTG